MEAVWAEQQAGAAGQAELDAQAKLEAAQAALKEATSHLGDVTDSNTDAVTSLTTRIGELRDELADGADLDGVDLGGLTDEQLESIAAAGRGVLESTQEYIDQHTATLRMLAGALGLPGMPPDPGPAAPFDLDREMALAAKLDRTNELLVAINDAIAGGGLFL